MKLHYLLALITPLISCTTYTAQQNDGSKKLKREEQAEHKQAVAAFAGLEPAPAGMVVSTHPAPQPQPMDYALAKQQENEKLRALKVAATNSTKRKSTNESALLRFLPAVLLPIINDYCFNYSAEFCPVVHRNVILKQIGKTLLGAIQVSCDGVLINSHHSHTIKLWDGETGKYIDEIKSVVCIKEVACNCNTVVVLNGNRILTIWDITTDETEKTKATCITTITHDPANPTDKFNTIAITLDGETIVTGSQSGALRKYSRSGTLLEKLEGDGSKIRSLAISADANTIVIINNKLEARLFNASEQSIVLPHTEPDEIDVNAFGNTIITTEQETANVKIWDRTGNCIAQVRLGALYTRVSLTLDGNTALMNSLNQPLVVWDITAKNFTFRKPKGTDPFPGGTFISRYYNDSASIYLLDSKARKQLASMKFEDLVALKQLLTQLSIAQGFNPETALGPDNTLIDTPHRDIILTPELGAALFALPLNLQQNICAFFDITETHEQFLKRTAST